MKNFRKSTEKTLCGLNSILREAWTISQANESGSMEKIKALNLAKDCYSMKLELLTNATVVDDAIRFVQSNRDSTNSGYTHLETVEPTDEVNETKRNKKIDGLLPQSNNEIVTVNKTF